MPDRSIVELITELDALRLRISQVEAELRVQQQSTHGPEQVTPIGLTRGDHVRITNQIRRPAVWPNTIDWNEETKEKERNATVTHIFKGQVHFITDNGTKTWRAANNLQKKGKFAP